MAKRACLGLSIITLLGLLVLCNSAAQASGLVAHWKLDEGTGNVASDSAGSNHGTVVDATWTTGQINGALSFDDYGDYVDLGIDPFSTLGQGTISAWVRAAEFAGSTIFNAKEGTDTVDYFYFWLLNGKLGLRCRVGATYPLTATGVTALQNNTWYHVVYTTDSSGNVFYINGSPETMTYDSGSSSSNVFFDDVPSSQLTTIGASRNYNGQNVTSFDGKIDDVRIYDKALSATEVQQLYQDGL